ncbi:MAG: formylmethanofuran dehydrogenase subunit E family protein, partial [Firmicutes bacterium]|nr:formylmethanofuran dehydrogenase subunit E family protein [Bacillota bacterium]
MALSHPDSAPDWFWPSWAAEARLPQFHLRDTKSSHGRYAQDIKVITGKDLVKFHGHACDGLFRAMLALEQGLAALFPDRMIDRTDLRVRSHNSPCLGDVAAYLTGGRIRFNTQDVEHRSGVWFVLQRISTEQAVEVHELPGVYPPELAAEEARLLRAAAASPEEIDRLREAQWDWVRYRLLAQ